MAIFRLQIKSISRGAGRSATAAAAYRAGERIRDERSGKLHNYSRRDDVLHKEILWPSRLAAQPSWAKDRAALWNTAERSESRSNARVAREYQLALPAELTPPQRLELARQFSRELADRHNVAIDLAVHAPRSAGDPRNFHAHLLATSRQVSTAGLGAKAGLDMASDERRRQGLPAGIAEIKAIRERWAVLSNEALAAAGLGARVDHRSLRAQGIDREPLPVIPAAAFYTERRGQHSELAERIRERYRSRVQARAERAAQPAAAAERAPALAAQPPAPAALEEVRRQARQAWLQMRATPPPAERAPELQRAAQLGATATATAEPPGQDLTL
jgi:ATP-dependent exoDNAse (exonuclease V) alpha subunit